MELWTNIATLATALAALFAILEMRSQRHSSYRPDLIMADAPLLVYSSQHRFFTTTGPLPSAQTAAPHPFGSGRIKCTNVGVGPAKFIRFRWVCEYEAFVERIGQLNPQLAAQVWIEEPFLHIDVREGQNRSFHNLRQQLTGTIAAVTPGSDTELSLPYAYLALFALYVFSTTRIETEKPVTTLPDPLPIVLELEYGDLGAKQHRSSFKLDPQIFAIHHGTGGGTAPEIVADGFLRVTAA